MPGPHEDSNVVPELLLALPQLGRDRAMEESGESSVTEGFLAPGMEKQKGRTMGARSGDMGPGVSVWGGLF